ncbi:STAS domain protein [Leptospira inadai serovar Lyme str. 10]|uniref:Anti-sigma factor antagonist n=2 Tax=Leptospira inadai serovar Lyme TaxID=293084 RepID=V6HH77_9LEPT|nr:STAS domain-containing protein [Leptospira inadai]EQA35570.1 STAS domain protein [Leptospira inadai serovar Lyme str. 10]PNV72458.1 anti-sigma factor antagonist [Leptospira inadai serovar Lyme]
MANLTFNEKLEGSRLILKVAGEIDAKTAPDLKLKLESAVGNGVKTIVCDCTALTYIASAGIGVLNSIQKFLKEKSGEIVFCSLKKEVKDTMELMYFTKKVRIFPNLEEALSIV